MRILSLLIRAIFAFYLAHEFAALFLLLLLEEAGIPLPLPGDILVTWAGVHHQHSIGYTITVLGLCSAGVFLGSSLLYAVMRRRGRPLLDRYGKYLHINPKRLDRMERWFRRNGAVAVLCGRMIPGLRIPTTVMAGLSDMPYRAYAPACAATALAWAALYFYLGELLQRPMRFIAPRVTGALDTLSAWVVVLGVAVLLAAVISMWYARRRANQRNAPPPADPPAGGSGPDDPPGSDPTNQPSLSPDVAHAPAPTPEASGVV